MARKRMEDPSLKSWDEVNAALKLIRDNEIELELIEADMGKKIADIKEQAAEQARDRARAVRVTGPRGRTAGRAASDSTSTTCSASAAQVTAAASPSIPRQQRATTCRCATPSTPSMPDAVSRRWTS